MALRASVPSVRLERLSRAARSAGEAFGHEEGDGPAMTGQTGASLSPWLWGAIGLAAALGLATLAFD